jgi:hypothetical protein
LLRVIHLGGRHIHGGLTNRFLSELGQREQFLVAFVAIERPMIWKFQDMNLIDRRRCFRILCTGAEGRVYSAAIGFRDYGCLSFKLVKRIGVANGE